MTSLEVQLVMPPNQPFAPDLNRVRVALEYVDSNANGDTTDAPINQPPRPRHVVSQNTVGLHLFERLVPDRKVKISVFGRYIPKNSEIVKLTAGRNDPIKIWVQPNTTATLSGWIEWADGTPATTQGVMHVRSEYDSTHTSSVHSSTAGHFKDRFQTTVRAGTVWLTYAGNDHAPSWLGPIHVKPGDERDDLIIKLQPGYSVPVRVVDETGAAIPGANVVAIFRVDKHSAGSRSISVDQEGNASLEHIAEGDYELRVTAAGFQPLRVAAAKLTENELLTLTMTASQITRGVVRTTDGKPAVGAKLRFRRECQFAGPDRAAGYGYGDVVATTDQDGRFALSELLEDSEYYYVLEGADESRKMIRGLKASDEVIQLTLAPRRDLRIEFRGDMQSLVDAQGLIRIGIRQRVRLVDQVGQRRIGDLIGLDVKMQWDPKRGHVVYKGLVPGIVSVRIGKDKTEIDVNESGETIFVYSVKNADPPNQATPIP
ncbi:MAG: carboxypeptidase regulatory-like domain-containing protein [Pirellulaceae bacterium]|nr:carboxypeptidase regulatory-like domain-containing protein [Pirellulaceae bacterium]